MSNSNLNNIFSENKHISATPKFSQISIDKESNMKIRSYLELDIPNLDEKKFSTEKKSNLLDLLIKQNKESKDIINPFKENFSLSSLLNENNNEDKNNNDNNDNNKIKIININMENPKQKRKIKTELISFGDKSDENNSTNNNEIIYREKINNSSMISNKYQEREENKETEKNINIDVDDSIERKSSDNVPNNNNSFQYNLPLENDKPPNDDDFFIFSGDNNTNISKSDEKVENNEKKENELNGNPINFHKKVDNMENKIEINTNYAYSKKNPKKNKIDRQTMLHKFLLNKKDTTKFEGNDKNNQKYNTNNNLLKNSLDSKELKRKIKFNSIDISHEIVNGTPGYKLLSDRKDEKDENFINRSTKIKKLKLFNLQKIQNENYNQIKNYSSRENLPKNKTNFDLNSKNIINNKNTNKNIKSQNSFYSKKNSYKNILFNKYPNLFSDFQRFKKTKENGNVESINTFRENMNSRYKNIINSITKNISYINKTGIRQNNNSNNLNQKIKINKNIFNSLIYTKNGNSNKTRNFDNIIFSNSSRKFNNVFYNTINYENAESKTVSSQNNNNVIVNNKNFLCNKKKNINKMKTSIQEFQKINKKTNQSNNNRNNNLQFNYNYKKNKNKVFPKISQNQIHANKAKENKNKIVKNINKPNNYLVNNYNKKKNKKAQKFYNKFIYNVFETNPNNESQRIKQISNNQKTTISHNDNIIEQYKISKPKTFLNDNSSTNSFQNNWDNKIKVDILFDKHRKIMTSPKLVSKDNNNSSIHKIYKKPRNTCLYSQYNNVNYTTNGNKIIIKKNINYKNALSELNPGNKSHRNSQIIQLRKKYSNCFNLTMRNSISNLKNYIDTNSNDQFGSMHDLNINQEKIRTNLKLSPKIDENIIKYSILRNNLHNQIINEFSLTFRDNNKDNNKEKEINNIDNKEKIDINTKKINVKKIEGNNDKKTIINFNQYYPSYFINPRNLDIKEKK